MSTPAISIQHLSKCYKLGTIGRHTLADEAQYLWHKIRGRNPKHHMAKIGHSATEGRRKHPEQENDQNFWALKDISFDVQPGEIVGLIGGNGAGKSTLLKLLSRITEPTSGEAVIQGRVASLLEVGTGFHPELTGRENVYMNGTILGMKKAEIDQHFDEIVAFSEIEKFIDTPVKRYSSGMYVRLAFAVAAHLQSEVLLVDEVLAVGDASFQKKCLGKMGDVAQAGRTIIFISHQMGAVAQLCKNVVVLREGRLIGRGATDEMIEYYLRDGAPDIGNEYIRPQPVDNTSVCIRAAKTVGADGKIRQEFDFRKPVTLIMDIDLPNIPRDTIIGVSLKDRLDRRLFTTEKDCEEIVRSPGNCRVSITIPGGLLAPGHYSFVMALHIRNVRIIDIVPSACRFNIVDTGSELAAYEGNDYGSFFVNCEWEKADYQS